MTAINMPRPVSKLRVSNERVERALSSLATRPQQRPSVQQVDPANTPALNVAAKTAVNVLTEKLQRCFSQISEVIDKNNLNEVMAELATTAQELGNYGVQFEQAYAAEEAYSQTIDRLLQLKDALEVDRE